MVPYMCGCISRHTRWVYRLVRVRSSSCWKSGAVGVRGGLLQIRRMHFF